VAVGVVVGTADGVWLVDGEGFERAGLEGKAISHVGAGNGTILAAVSHDGLYVLKGAGGERIWEGDARACAVGPDGAIYVGAEPAMVHRSDDDGASWARMDKIDGLPTRSTWYFPPPPHEPHVRSIDFLPGQPSSILVGVEVGGVLVSTDRGDTWEERNNGVHVDVHTVRPDPTRAGRLLAVTGGGVFGSEDDGASWTRRQAGLRQGYAVGLHFNPERSGEVLIATGQSPPGVNGLVYHSIDAGESWVEITDPALPGHYDRVPVVLFADGRAWIMTSDGQVLRAEGPGGPWSQACELPAAVHCAAGDGSPSSIMGWR
jgi:photosystem II stability/assembly factor-like uncharacterized protein